MKSSSGRRLIRLQMRKPVLFFGVLIGSLGCAHAAQTDVLSEAIAFATTGDDSTDVTPLDKAACVYAIKPDYQTKPYIIHLDNIQFDRVDIHEEDDPLFGGKYVAVYLRGDGLIYQKFVPGVTQNSSNAELIQKLQQKYPEGNWAHLYSDAMSKDEGEYRLQLHTLELDRVVRAWKFISENGCPGQKSPFRAPELSRRSERFQVCDGCLD